MMKLRRVYETAEEENRVIEEVALDKFGTLEAFEEAQEERRILDERESRRTSRRSRSDGWARDSGGDNDRGGEQRFMFSEVGSAAIAGRISSFRRPGGQDHSAPSTPGVGRGSAPPPNRRLDSLRLPSEASSPATASSVPTPIPTILTPPIAGHARGAGMSPAELNKLQAKVLKAKLMGTPDAERLEQEYEAEVARAHNGGMAVGVSSTANVRVELLPTLDARGRLYDTGQGRDDGPALPGNRKRKDWVFRIMPCHT